MFRLLSVILVIFAYGILGDVSYYSSYYGEELTSDDVAAYTANNTIANCTNIIQTCNSTEGRRINGSCNNLDNPQRGASHTPYNRVLPAQYNQTTSTQFDPRLDQDGNELPLAREIRRNLISEGRISDKNLTGLITHMAVFFTTDITNTRDTTNYVSYRPYCCKEEGKSDSQCVPNTVTDSDYVMRYSDIRCLNMTRPFTFQTSGCLPTTSTPMRIVEATPTFDASPIYGNVDEPARRNFTGGLLKVEIVDGISFPPTSGISLLLGINFFGIIFFWRLHNHIATQLAAVNPCWDDEQLFSTAREINIAYGLQIMYYELYPLMMNREKMIEDGVISNCTGFRDIYNSSLTPQVSLEYVVALRWWHKIQDGAMKMFYTNGTYFKQYPMVNLTARIDYLKEDQNLIYITQGCFRQPCGKVDDFVADPDIVENGLGALQRANDIMTNDLAKNRYFGLPGYIEYRKNYFGDNITCFDDLNGILDSERLEEVKLLYKYVEDIDLMAGMWTEPIMEGAWVPPTVSKILTAQMLHSAASDRHWYESSTRPNAFTEDQLAEIRKATAARLLCDIGDNVTEIQPQAFLLPGDGNEIVDCSCIPTLDYSAWADDTCSSS